MINWEMSEKEMDTIYKISERFKRDIVPEADLLIVNMDIAAAHLNGCPLNLDKLLNSQTGDFLHDVCGIQFHIDRETGKLEECFLPRCAA